jgi:hypothetical protein
MSGQLATRIIDGDGHIMEDNAGIIAHMDSPYREIAQRKGVVFPPLDHLHAGRAVETPPQRDQRPAVGPQGWLDFLDDVGIEWTVLYQPRLSPTARSLASTTPWRSRAPTTIGSMRPT